MFTVFADGYILGRRNEKYADAEIKSWVRMTLDILEGLIVLAK